MSGSNEPIALRRLDLDEFPSELAQALEPRVHRLGYLGEFFRCMAHQPEALLAFNAFTERSKDGLTFEWTEVIALTCATWMENAYERHQHERLCLTRNCSRDWIAAVIRLTPDASDTPLSADEVLIQRFTLAVLESLGHEAGGAFEALVAALGEKQAVAALMVIGRYVVHALIVNTLRLAPPVPSIFDEQPAA